MTNKDETATVKTDKGKKFDLATLVKSRKYSRYKALLPVLLKDGKMYSEADVDKALKAELSRPVTHDVN